MKRLSVFLAALLVLGTAFAAAQPVPGKKIEVGTSLSFYSIRYEYADGFSNSFSILNVPIRVGWFFWKGLAIEPEVLMTIPIGEGKGTTSYFFAANLAYNFKAKGKLVPFIGGSAGLGNGVPYICLAEGSSGTTSTAFGGLAGIKYLFGDIAALRIEYRLLFYTWKDSEFPDDNETGTIHRVLVGFSIFF